MCCSAPSCSDRKILERVLRRSVFSRFFCLRRGTSCLASGRPLRGMMDRASAVSLSKFRIITRGYRVGSAGCSLNILPLISKLRLPLLWRHFVHFFCGSLCDLVPAFLCVVRATVFWHALTVICVLYHPSRMVSSVLFEQRCSAVWYSVLQLQTTEATHYLFCRFCQRFLLSCL